MLTTLNRRRFLRLGGLGAGLLPAPQGGALLVGVNETLNRTTAPELTDAFVRD